MRKIACLFASFAAVGGCEHMSNTEKGAGVGGLIGAGTGALVGNAVGHTGAGALIGGGVGALAGALTGNAVDKAEHRADQAQLAAAAAAPGPLELTDIAQLAQQHVSDDVIISQIRSTSSIFRLSPSDITWLKANGVSDRVVMEMQQTATRPVRRVYTSAPVERVYIYEPPPPPVYMGVGYSHYRRW